MIGLIALLLVILGLIALGLGRRFQTEAGLPIGRVVYADTGGWHPVEKPLYSPRYRLAGKPDYLVQRGRQLVPVEVKSSTAPGDGPRRSHVLQLAAYCLLVQENYATRPRSGIIKYADQTFEIDFTPGLESSLLDVIDAMRNDLRQGPSSRSHDEPARCLRCGMQSVCDERLA
jgi:CRISPR-associated exonuclease Cas4